MRRARVGSWLCLAVVWAVAGCDDGGAAKAKADEAAQQAKREADDAQAEAKRRAAARKEQEAQAEREFLRAKAELDPLAVLPKKLPKSFSSACVTMLEAYDAFMQKALTPEELVDYNDSKETRTPRLRRVCHQRPVEVVACQIGVLNKAPPQTDVDHIMRLCVEKFSG